MKMILSVIITLIFLFNDLFGVEPNILDVSLRLQECDPFLVRTSCYDTAFAQKTTICYNTSVDIRRSGKHYDLMKYTSKYHDTKYMIINRLGRNSWTFVGEINNNICIPYMEFCMIALDSANKENIIVYYYDENDSIRTKLIPSSAIHKLFSEKKIMSYKQYDCFKMFDIICVEYSEKGENVLFHWNNFWRFGKEAEDIESYFNHTLPIFKFLQQLHKESIFKNRFGAKDRDFTIHR